MSADAKTYTERDLVLAKREAFVAGADWAVRPVCGCFESIGGNGGAAREAAGRYPLPKVTRSRVVEDTESPFGDTVEWSVRDDALCFRVTQRDAVGPWHRWLAYDDEDTGLRLGTDFMPTAKRCALWAALLANPTEEVES